MKSRRNRAFVTPSALWNNAGKLSPVVAAAAVMGLTGLLRAQQQNTLPQNGQVVNGQATINQNGNYMGINASNGAVINWQSFNIGQGQTVQFFQPDAQSRVLNRITGPDPSRIAGSLISNGIVYISNPAGVYFAHGSLVDVGGIYAAAGSITNNDFVNNNNHFTGVTGTVENKGTINAATTSLIGQRVSNYGTINAPNGMVTMAAGDDVYVGERNGQVFARVSGGSGPVGVTQAGQINASGGRVVLGSGDMYAMAIDHPGSTRAKEIHLEGGATGVVSVSGTLDASNQAAGGKGGTIEVLGDKVGIYGGHLNASGENGGGTILVGGDKQGQGDVRRADAVYVSSDSTLKADSTTNGDGGKVIVWSDRFTNFQGKISAKGGSQSGNGGFIETSGKKDLYMAGAADASASHGRAGQWLLDPTDVTLSNAVTTGGVLGGGGVFTPGNNNTANVNLTSITNALSSGTSVTINTASSGGGGGDITLVDPLSVNMTGGGATLTLNAVRDIFISNTITGTGSAGNELGLAFNAGRDVTISSAISLNGGAFAINSAGIFQLTSAVTTGGGAFALVNSGLSQLGAGIDAGTGNITFSSDLVLSNNVTLAGHDLTFNGTVNSDSLGTPRDLFLNSTGSGTTRFNADVGAIADLGTVTTNADGSTILNSQFFMGTAVTFNDAFQVNVDGVVRGLASVTFNSTIASESGERNDLQVNSPLTVINGTVGAGAGARLGLFQTNDVGTTTINTAAINAERVNFKDNVVLGVTTFVSATTSAAFAGLIDSQASEFNGLTITSPLVSLGGNIGQGTNGTLGLLRISQPGTTTLNCPLISSVQIDFNSDLVLGSSSSMFGSVASFTGKVDSQSGEANSLTVNAGILTFSDDIGQATGGALGTLHTGAATPVFLDGLTITAANVNFETNVVVAQTSTVRGTSSVNFGGTINSQTGEQNGLTIGGAAISIVGSVGQGSGGLLGLLRTETGGTATVNSGVISSAQIDFQSGLLLGTNLSLFGSQVTLAGAINSDNLEVNSLTINAPLATISGSVGQAIGGGLATLTTGAGTTVTLSGAQMFAGNFEFLGAVVAGGDTTLTATGRVRFESTIDSIFNLHDRLTINAPLVNFTGDIGAATGGALGVLALGAGSNATFDGSTIIGEAITFNGTLLLNQDTTITGSTSVTFGDRVDSANNLFNDLQVNSPLTTFAGRVGELTHGSSLGTLRTNIAGTTTITTNSITADTIDFADAVVLGATTTLNAASSVVFLGTLNSAAAGAFGLTVNGPLVRFSGQVGNAGATTALGSISTDASGLTVINTDVFKAADISLADVVVIAVDTTITGTTSVRFGLAVDSEANEANDLTVNSPLTNFDGVVGGGTNGALGALVTDAPGATTYAGAVTAASLTAGDTVNINGGTITTTLNQTYNGQVFLGADTTLAGHDMSFNLSLNSGLTDRNLTVNSTGGGITTFSLVGTINPLRSLTTNGDGRTVFTGAQVITGGDQTYNDLLFLNTTTNISATNVTFLQTVNSDATPRSLNIDTTNNGITIFSAAVGDVSPLLRLTTNADGTTRINGGAITTTSTQAFNDVAVLGADTILAGGSVAFGSTLNSDSTARNLTINTSGGGLTTFNGSVGGAAPLASLTTNGDGSTRLNGGVIRTTGDQSFGDGVILGADTTLTANDITFSSTIDSTALLSAAALTVNSSTNGITTFNGNVGSTQALKSLTTNADGKSRIGASITTGAAGSQSYGDAVLIFRNSVLTDAGGTGISFASTIDSEGSPHALSILTDNASNASIGNLDIARISFGGNVGSTLALSQLRIGGNRTTVPSVATIVAGLNASGTPISNFSITFNTTGAFAMGAMQKMTVVGNVTINAGGAAAVSDISALGNITVNASSIQIRTRPAATTLALLNGALVNVQDAGTDFVAGGTITFSAAPTLLGGFGTANFATPDSSGISATLQGFAQRSLGSPVTAAMMRSGTTYLDLSATGPSNTNIATIIAGEFPDWLSEGSVATDTGIGQAERDQLNELGIATRTPEGDQLLQFLLGRAMVSDITDVGGPTATDHAVTINRLPTAIVRRVLETYRSVFSTTTVDPQTGIASIKSQTDHVVQVLNAAYAEYSAAAGAKADALGFRAYLESVPAKAEALNYMNSLRELFTELGYLGLTPTENRIARNRILRSLPIKGMTPTQLETTITTRQLGGVS